MTKGMVEVAFPLDANIQVMGELVDRLGMPTKKVITDLYNFGNPSVASIPLALDGVMRSSRVKMGGVVVYAGFVAGVS